MNYLFNKPLESYDDWLKVYQSIEEFKPLIQHIYLNQDITISTLTPGTNAVFKVNNQVIKIFAPSSTKINSNDDFKTEINNIKQAKINNIPCPDLLDYGIIHDRYDFEYIILKYVEGVDACIYLKQASNDQQIEFVEEFVQLLTQLQIKTTQKSKVIELALNNFRIKKLHPKLQDEIKTYIKTLPINDNYYLHGDLTGENVRMSNKGMCILDFADTTIAPVYYDYCVIVFDLFKDYPKLVKEFIKQINDPNFEQQLFNSLCIHDYGADFITYFYESFTHQNIVSLTSLSELKNILHQYLSTL